MEWASAGPTPSPRPLVYITRAYAGKRYGGTFYDPNVHVVLEFDQDAVGFPAGDRTRLPSIRGISGCGIWRVANLDGIAHCSAKRLRLVGLQHRWVRDDHAKYIQGTWIKYALQLILDNYPNLQGPMNLVYPRDQAP
jgi:hypothetical protein